MIRRLIILLLIVGCEKDTPTESSVHPLVGVWKGIEVTITSGTTTSTIQYDENNSVTWIFGEDGIASMTYVIEDLTRIENTTWSATDNKLILLRLLGEFLK